ncbi:MAG TPA: methyltransferase [Streptosporangiaceae bacterium]|jgi:ubiquinone/menaquinone biosynthesis C-methylase UbiE
MSTTESRQTLTPLPLMQLTTGFWASKTLFAAHELDLFALLERRGGGTAEQVAADLKIAERPAEMLLTACASLGLLDKRRRRYENSPIAAKYLVPGKPDYFGDFIAFNDKRVYDSYRDLTGAVRSNRPVGWDPAAQRSFFDSADPLITRHFYEAMHSLSTPTGQALASVPGIHTRSRLLDVGGGSGAVAIELCRALPDLTATVCDLPHVIEFAARKVAEAGLADRITTAECDLFAPGPYPTGHDVALLSLILHSFTPEQGKQILAKTFACLPSGGLLLISELMVNDDKTGPPPAALMSLTMLVEDEGRSYTAAEYEEWLGDTGFQQARRVTLDVPGANGLITAEKP